MSKFLTVWKNLMRSNRFLKILSVVIAFIIWICIITLASPVNVKSLNKIPVDVSFEGSVAERNGLMMLMTDTTLSVNVEVSGKRSSLITVQASDVTASLNFDAITTAGTYQVPVDVTVDNAGITVSDISPNAYVVIQFAESATREIPVTIQYQGSYPDGFAAVSEEITPKTVTVTGPKETVDSIQTACIKINPSSRQTDYEATETVHLLNASGTSVDRRFITVSDTEATARVDMQYSAVIPFAVNVTNAFGGNEPYTTVQYSVGGVTVKGEYDDVRALDALVLGEIQTQNYKDGDTVTFTLPVLGSSLAYVNAPKQNTVTATVTFPDTEIVTLTYSAQELNLRNLLNSYSFREGVTVKVRAPKNVTVTKSNVVFQAGEIADGKCHLSVSLSNTTTYGLLQECYAKVSID